MEATYIQHAVSLLSRLPEASGERIDVRLAQAVAPGDVSALARGAGRVLRGARTVVVDGASLALAESDRQALAEVAAAGVRVVVAAPRPVPGFPPLLVLHEVDFARALSASVYALEPGEALVVLSPQPADAPGILRPLLHALRWRAAWGEPEAGDFSPRPA